jgi:hypothetical protein
MSGQLIPLAESTQTNSEGWRGFWSSQRTFPSFKGLCWDECSYWRCFLCTESHCKYAGRMWTSGRSCRRVVWHLGFGFIFWTNKRVVAVEPLWIRYGFLAVWKYSCIYLFFSTPINLFWSNCN